MPRPVFAARPSQSCSAVDSRRAEARLIDNPLSMKLPASVIGLVICASRRVPAVAAERAARQHHDRPHLADQIPVGAGLVARRQDGGVSLGRLGQAGSLRRHAGPDAGGADRLPGRSRHPDVGRRRRSPGSRRTRFCFRRTACCGPCRRPRRSRRACRAASPMPATSRCRATASRSRSRAAGRSGWRRSTRKTQRPVTGLTPMTASNPVLSRDGQWIAFLSTGGGLPADPGLLPSTAIACASSATATASSPAARPNGGSASSRCPAATSRGFRPSEIRARCSSRPTDRCCGRKDRRTARRGRSRCGTPAAPCARCGRIRTSAGSRRPAATRRSSSRPTASRSRSSAIAAAGFTST